MRPRRHQPTSVSTVLLLLLVVAIAGAVGPGCATASNLSPRALAPAAAIPPNVRRLAEMVCYRANRKVRRLSDGVAHALQEKWPSQLALDRAVAAVYQRQQAVRRRELAHLRVILRPASPTVEAFLSYDASALDKSEAAIRALAHGVPIDRSQQDTLGSELYKRAVAADLRGCP